MIKLVAIAWTAFVLGACLSPGGVLSSLPTVASSESEQDTSLTNVRSPSTVQAILSKTVTEPVTAEPKASETNAVQYRNNGAAEGEIDRKNPLLFLSDSDANEGGSDSEEDAVLVEPGTACYGCCAACSSCTQHSYCNHCDKTKCYFGGVQVFTTQTPCATGPCACSSDPSCNDGGGGGGGDISLTRSTRSTGDTTTRTRGCFEFKDGWTCNDAGYENDQAHPFKAGPCIDILNMKSGEIVCFEEDHLVRVEGKWVLAREIRSDGVRFKVLGTRHSERLSSCWFGGQFYGNVLGFEVATFPMLTPDVLAGTVPVWLIRLFNGMFGYY